MRGTWVRDFSIRATFPTVTGSIIVWEHLGEELLGAEVRMHRSGLCVCVGWGGVGGVEVDMCVLTELTVYVCVAGGGAHSACSLKGEESLLGSRPRLVQDSQ